MALGALHYQWLRDGVPVGNDSATYAPGDGDVGAAISVTVTFVDGDGFVETESSTSTGVVTGIPDAPQIDAPSSPVNVLSDENSIVAASIVATDDDLPSQDLTFSVIGGADQAKFSISPVTGVLSFVTAPNFELPTDADQDNRYEVTVQVSDGTLTDSRFYVISVVNVNDGPQIGNFGGTLAFRENQGQRTLGNVAALVDVDSPDFAGGVLTVTLTDGGNSNDRLEIRDRTGTPNRIGISGHSVLFNSVVVGTWTGGVELTPLSVTLNASATRSIVQALLRSITFRSMGDTPDISLRTIEFVVSDGDGGTSAATTKQVAIEAVNDRPVLAVSGTTNFIENQSPRILSSAAMIADPDSFDFDTGTLTVRVAQKCQS